MRAIKRLTTPARRAILKRAVERDGTESKRKWLRLCRRAFFPRLLFAYAPKATALAAVLIVGFGVALTCAPAAHARNISAASIPDPCKVGRHFTITDASSATDCDRTGGGATKAVCVCASDASALIAIEATGGGEANTSSSSGAGLSVVETKSGVDLPHASFATADFDLAASVISIDDATWLNEAELDDEAELESQLGDVTDVYTNNDGALLAAADYVAVAGDTMTGDLVLDDGTGDSPTLTMTPATDASAWSIFSQDGADPSLRIEASDVTNASAYIANTAANGNILFEIACEGGVDCASAYRQVTNGQTWILGPDDDYTVGEGGAGTTFKFWTNVAKDHYLDVQNFGGNSIHMFVDGDITAREGDIIATAGDIVATAGVFTGANVTSGIDPGHTHTTTSISALDAADITTGEIPDARVSDTLTASEITCTDCVADAEVVDTITASNYMPLSGSTFTGEVVVDDLGLEFTAGDAITDCTSFSATGGGIYYDDSEGIFKKCQDNVLTDLDTGAGTVNTADIADVSVTATEFSQLETLGATTISANQWSTLGGIAETLGSAELNLLDGLTVLSGNNTGDQDLADTVAEITDLDNDAATLSLPASTTISAFGATLIDDAAASNARTTLGVDVAGTDNSTDVTLAGTPDYITISGQVITRGSVDLAADVTGNLSVNNLNNGTGATGSTWWRGDGTWAAPSGSGDVTDVGPACATGACLTDGVATTGTTLFVWEGTGVDTNEVTLAMSSANPGADYTITFPDETGTVVTSATTEVRSMYWGAGAMSADGTNCSAPAEVTLNSGPKVYSVSCTVNASSVVYGSTVMPDSWDGGTVDIEITVWHGTTEAITYAGDFSAQCRGDAEVPSSTWGTAVAADVTIATANQIEQQTAATITPAGTCAGGDMLYWRWVMDSGNTTANGANTDILGAKLEYTSNVGD